jgi:hypothetical protein
MKRQKKVRCAYRIFKSWQRSRIRRYCYILLEAGKQILIEKRLQEEREYLEYRLRVAKRRVQEDQQFKEWKDDKKVEFKKQIKELKLQKEKVDHQIAMVLSPRMKKTHENNNNNNKEKQRSPSPPQHRSNSPVPGTDPVVRSPSLTTRLKHKRIFKTAHKEMDISDISDAELRLAPESKARLTADEQLLSDDPRLTRPDLAPFSTMINEMIRTSLTASDAVNGELIKPRRPESMLFGDVPFTSILSAKFMHPSRPKTLRESVPVSVPSLSAPHPLVNTPSGRLQSRTMSFSVPQPPTQATPLIPSSPQRNPSKRFSFSSPIMPGGGPPSIRNSLEFSMKMQIIGEDGNSSSDFRASFGTLSTPYASPRVMNWEDEADVSRIPTIQEMKNEKKYKTPAFLALEKLSNLTEADIRSIRKEVQERDIVNEVAKQKRNQTSHLIFL